MAVTGSVRLEESQQARVGPLLSLIGGLHVLVLAWAILTQSYNVWGGVVVACFVALICYPLLVRLSRSDVDPWVRRVLILGFAAKQVGSGIRYYVVTTVLGGDALKYHEAGSEISPFIRARDFGAPEFVSWVPDITGTTTLRIITGVVYIFVGTARYAGFVVFATFAFWGAYLMFRAFQMAVPDGLHRRYALLVFFAPTLLFWPSSTGKDAWMILMIGIVVHGAVRIFLLAPGGYALVSVGLAGSAVIRVHLTVILLGAAVLGYLLARRPRHAKGKLRGFFRGFITIGFVLGAIVFTATQAQSFFDEIGGGTVSGTLEETTRRSSTGGSEFTPSPVTSPTGLPVAIATVLFRPFPQEAHNVAARFTSLEGLVLMGLSVLSTRRLLRLPLEMRDSPLVGLAVVYSALFIVAFSTLGNFGILARQRSQLYPIFFVLLALPKRISKRKLRAQERARKEEQEALQLLAPDRDFARVEVMR